MGVFGGSKTTVSQQAAAASDVNVDITNVIDTEGMALVLEQFGAAVVGVGERTNDILATLFERDVHTRQADVLVRLQGAKVENERVETMKKAGNILLAGTAIYLVYKGAKK